MNPFGDITIIKPLANHSLMQFNEKSSQAHRLLMMIFTELA